MATELAKRVAVAAVGIPFLVAVIYIGGWVFAGVLAVVAALGALEFYGLTARATIEPFRAAGAAAAALLVLTAASASPSMAANRTWNTTLALLLVFATLAILLRAPDKRPAGAIAVTVGGALYTGGTLAYAVWLRAFPESASRIALATPTLPVAWRGAALVGFPLLVTWINDTAAYFVGRAVGRRKLMPRVSPGKTVEGAIAGLLGGMLVAVWLGRSVIGPQLGITASVIWWAVGGIVVAAVGQIGDLAESLVKREAGAKDSGRLLPGHGGVLDRFDALFFAFPVAYWYLRWLGLE
ncbi:MAG TPA: phosphatidate cytidylyltransferase [Longimicrobiales bacterium]|nr:phosphatidate cytidylyltransferase [Longimicrobiales bacterium]